MIGSSEMNVAGPSARAARPNAATSGGRAAPSDLSSYMPPIASRSSEQGGWAARPTASKSAPAASSTDGQRGVYLPNEPSVHDNKEDKRTV